MSCLFSVHQAVQVCSHTSPVLGTARAAHSRGFALEPRPSVPPHALSPCCNSHLMLLCCCPGDSAGAGRRRSVIHGITKGSQTEGAVSDRPGTALGLTHTPRFRVRPSLSRPRNTGGFHCPRTQQGPEQPGRAATVRVLHQDPQEGAGGAAEGRDGGAGLVALLAVAAGSATGDSGWPVTNAPLPARPVSLSHRPQARGQLSPCVTAREPPGRVTRPSTRQMSSGTPGTSPPETPKSTRPAAIFGDPGGSPARPKVPSPHWG